MVGIGWILGYNIIVVVVVVVEVEVGGIGYI